MDNRKISLVKKNFYLAIAVVVLLFVVGFVIAATTWEPYDLTKASHGNLYVDNIGAKDTATNELHVKSKLFCDGGIDDSCGAATGGVWGSVGNGIYYNNGGVGIGTTSPQTKLDVTGSSADGVLFQINDTYNALLSAIEPVFAIHNNRFGKTLEIASGGYIFQYVGGNLKNFFSSYGDSFITGGNVGIGTTKPTEKLEVVGNIKASGTICDGNGNCIGEGTGGGVSLGSWEVKNLNQVYTAATDGVVLAFCYAANSANGLTPDGTSPRTGCEASGTQADGFTMLVRAGDTWRVALTSGAGNVDVYWIPLEGGGGSGGVSSWGDWTDKDNVATAFTYDTTYKVTSDGFLSITGAQREIKLYVSKNKALVDSEDSSVYVASDESGQYVSGMNTHIGFMVAKDEYWRVDKTDGQLIKVVWRPMGNGQCIKQ